MENCQGCGAELPSEGTNFCRECGAPVQPDTSARPKRSYRLFLWIGLAVVVLAGAAVGAYFAITSGGEKQLYAAVGANGYYGFIDTSGEWVIQPQFEFDVEDEPVFSEGMAVVQTDDSGLFGYIDETGSVVIQPRFAWAGDFNDGLACVAEDEDSLCGFIDKTGAMVIPARFDFAWSFSEGLAAVVLDDKVGFIDTKGNVVIGARFEGAGSFEEGLAVAWSDPGGPAGFIDQTGAWVIAPSFEDVNGFSEGLAVFRDDEGMWGAVDKTGATVIPPRFADLAPFFEGLAAAQETEDGPFGFIDKQGNWVIQPQFTIAGAFSDGLTPVAMDESGSWGYVDSSGAYAIPPQYIEAWGFVGGLAQVGLQDGYGYIDNTGRLVWRSDPGAVAEEETTTTEVYVETTAAPPVTTEPPVQVTWETGTSPCYIKYIFSQGGVDYITVDYIQVKVADDATAYDPILVNQNSKLRTFIVPADAKLGARYLLTSLGRMSLSQVQDDARYLNPYGIPVSLDTLREGLALGVANFSGNEYREDWWEYIRWWDIEVRDGKVVSLTESLVY